MQRQFNTKTKEQEEHQEFINLDESKCEGTWVLLTLATVSNFIRMVFVRLPTYIGQ